MPPPVPMSEIPGVRTRPARMPCGTYAPNLRLSEFSNDVPGFTVHPDDMIGTERHPDLMRSIGCCQGPTAGGGGLNLPCQDCGAEVATWQADCYTQNQVILGPAAVCLCFFDD
ncbi:hypothetical protein OOK58_57575 [Streptomyces sp. NBC_01728]|uniref:hypothetical protein n=2 Tax=Streptomyces TaxID=1883 RepID=UPI00224F5196|nr:MULTISPECIES: hypothetical protein [unclassified Streptomyces]MCX4460090.1 hypothetical protein [Streptomyces sp. NBC_01719]MCX4500579.1 hypothetical protein [Streptomyces sp. NBC_01728]